MTKAKEVILQQLRSGQDLYEKFTADLADREYFVSPAEGCNHTAWLVGHVACSEDSLVSQITGGAKRIPDATHELFKAGSKCVGDASKYPSRVQIDKLFHDSRMNTMGALTRYDDRRWDEPSPEGWDKSVFPTMGAMWGLQGTHQFWHLGQLTVCRQVMRKKNVLV